MSRCGEFNANGCHKKMWKKRRGACSVVFRESDEKKIQYCTATHSAVGARNSVRADVTKNEEKRRGAYLVVESVI